MTSWNARTPYRIRAGAALLLTLSLTAGCGLERVDQLDGASEGPVITLVDTLLALQAEERRVHLEYEAEAFVALMADSTIQVNRGEVSSQPREALLQRFGAYFEGTTFIEWADVHTPRIRADASAGRASVLVERRVRGVSIDAAGRAVGHHTRFAWSEEWARTPDGWRIVQVVSTDRPGEPDAIRHELGPPNPETGDEVDLAARADSIRMRARTALSVRWDLPHLGRPFGAAPFGAAPFGAAPFGAEPFGAQPFGADAAPPELAGLESLSFVAACHGPDGPFRTAVWSGGGRVEGREGVGHRMLQRRGGETEVTDLEYSEARISEPSEAARDRLYGFATAHSQLLLALDAGRALGTPTLMERSRFAGEEAEVLSFTLADWRMEIFYSVDRGLPLGTRLDIGPESPPVITYWSDWEPVPQDEADRAGIGGPLLLPRRIALVQGEEYFTYRIERIGVNRARGELSLE